MATTAADADPYVVTTPRAAAYSPTAVMLHWLTAATLPFQIALGAWMQGIPEIPRGFQAGWYNLHKSIGLTLGLLIVVRIAWRRRHRPPALPSFVPAWQQRAATATHLALYACLVALPVSGLVGSLSSRYPVRFWGVVLPVGSWGLPAVKAVMSAVHAGVAWLLVALIMLHVAGALRHALAADGVAGRMTRWQGRP